MNLYAIKKIIEKKRKISNMKKGKISNAKKGKD